jgi:hypothetical protein
VNVAGKYVFRAKNTDSQVADGCENSGTGSDFCLTPVSVDIIGHRPVTITGIRLNSTNHQVFCRYIDPNANETEILAEVLTFCLCQNVCMYYQIEINLGNNLIEISLRHSIFLHHRTCVDGSGHI